MGIEKKWGLDREPSTIEKVIAGVGAMVILIVALVFLSVMSAMLLSGKSVLLAFCVALLLFLGSLVLLVRVLIGQARKPSKGAIKRTGYVLLSLSFLMLAIPLFGTEDLAGSVYAVSVGLTGIAGSTLIIRQASVRGNS